MRRLIYVAVLCVVAILAGGLYAWYSVQDRQLTEKPPVGGVPLTVAAADSTVGVRVAVPYAALTKVLNDSLPSSYSDAGNGEDVCASIFGRNVCVGTRYSYTAKRFQALKISREGNRLKASIGISIDGKGGFRGTGADILGLDEKSFSAAAIITVTLGVAINNQWCPDISANASYNWTKEPRVEIVSRAWINVSSLLNGKVDDALKDLPAKLRQAIPCAAVRSEVAKVWKGYDIPVEVAGNPPVHVLISPQKISLSPLIVDDAEFRLAVQLDAKTEVATEPRPLTVPDLPAPGRIGDEAGRLAVRMPVSVNYGFVQQQLTTAVDNKPFSTKIGEEEATVTISAIEVYPSGKGLAVGMDFRADLPTRIFDVTGKLYAVTTPSVDKSGLKIGFADFAFARQLDNELWDALSVILQDQLKKTVESSVVDLTPRIEEGRKALADAIADPAKTGGIQFTVQQPDARIESILPLDKALTVVALVSARIDARLTARALAEK